MANPFEKRATEYLRDSDTFLSIVTPEPLKTFLEPPAQEEKLYDRLTIITGTPGSGKTTIASLLQFHFVDSLRRNQTRTGYSSLVQALAACRAIDEDGRPRVVGVRLPLEAEYRDFWQLPYSPATKTRLVLALLQARAILGWLRNITTTGQYSLDELQIVARPGTDAAIAHIGGLQPTAVRAQAIEVERAVYGIGAALVPPSSEDRFPEAARFAYHPFDVIEAFQLKDADGPLTLQPLVMLDDAHTLHPDQLAELNRNLARRELRIARWVLTRVDALSPTEALLAPSATTTASPQLGRDVTIIAMQKGEDRDAQRKAFRRMARDMADRYLRQMPEFSLRGHDRFSDLLETAPSVLSEQSLQKLRREADQTCSALRIAAARRATFEQEIKAYCSGAKSSDTGEDIQLAMLMILCHRYGKRVPQATLFAGMDDVEPSKPLKADADVAAGARIHLHHKYGRPYYYGIEAVCDAASDNAEQFLHLAARLVAKSEVRLLRNRQGSLDARLQHQELSAGAAAILREHDYPYFAEVEILTTAIARQCLEKSLEPNASLDGGASAVGILQKEFDAIPTTHPRLAQVLKFAVAYNAITLAQNYGQGTKRWALLELGGCVLVSNGLTLRRGGFLERTAQEIAALLPDEEE